MEKYDVKKAHKTLYSPGRKDFALVQVPTFRYLAVDGHGDPNTAPDYAQALEALYPAAYTLKFASKKAGRDFAVAPLEGLWSAPDMGVFTAGEGAARNKDSWEWTMMLNIPDWVTPAQVRAALEIVAAKKNPPGVDKVRLLELHEGACVQILHLGSYDDEGPVLAKMHSDFMTANGLDFNGRHHEIYLSDPRRTAPEKLKTILRQPVVERPAAS